MPFLILLSVLVLPVLEIISFVQVSRWIGLLPMLLALGFSAAVGFYLIRSQSLAVGPKVLRAMREGTAPEKPLLDAAMLNFAGVLLIIPGFFSDLIALLLLIPTTRQILWQRASSHAKSRFDRYRATQTARDRTQPPQPPRQSSDVIDVEFTEVPPEKSKPRDIDSNQDSPWRKKP